MKELSALINAKIIVRKKIYIGLLIFTSFVMLFQKHFTIFPKKATILVFILAAMIVFFWSEKAEINVLLMTSSFGILFSLGSPVFEVWDEPAHFTRVEYISEGNMSLSNEKKDHYVSKDVEKLVEISRYTTRHDKILPDFFNVKLWNYRHNEEKEYQFRVPVTNAYGTISYLPSTIGFNIGKWISNGNLGIMFYLGRICNSLFYAFCAYLAVKISKKWKYILSFFALQPMVVYVSASFNQDAFSYGFILLTIAYFLKMLQLEDYGIRVKDLIIFLCLCSTLAFTKLPYIVFAGLVFFLPVRQFKNKQTYFFMIITILIVIVVSGWWYLTYTKISGLQTSRNVDVQKQVLYIINNPREFVSTLFTSIFSVITKYRQLATYAWDNQNAVELGLVNLMTIGVVYCYPLPQTRKISSWTKFGVAVISSIIMILIYLSMYLTWTEVSATYISGVQGRYFVGILTLTPIIFNISKYIGKFESNPYSKNTLQAIGLLLLIWTLAARVGTYY